MPLSEPDQVLDAGDLIVDHGFSPSDGERSGERLALLAETRPRWFGAGSEHSLDTRAARIWHPTNGRCPAAAPRCGPSRVRNSLVGIRPDVRRLEWQGCPTGGLSRLADRARPGRIHLERQPGRCGHSHTGVHTIVPSVERRTDSGGDFDDPTHPGARRDHARCAHGAGDNPCRAGTRPNNRAPVGDAQRKPGWASSGG